MSLYVIPPPDMPALPVTGSDMLYPVHRIYCVGRNYAEHAIEMGHDPDKEPPFFFQKNPDNLLSAGAEFPYPPLSNNVQHELELVVHWAAAAVIYPWNTPWNACLAMPWAWT